jgi:hypothetical protein
MYVICDDEGKIAKIGIPRGTKGKLICFMACFDTETEALKVLFDLNQDGLLLEHKIGRAISIVTTGDADPER